MLRCLTLVLVLQLCGEAIAEAAHLTIPGPVIGMVGLFVILCLTGGPTESMRATAGAFLDNLGLLFVPAGVGVSLHLALAAEEWPAILAATVIGTLVTIVAVAVLFERLARGSRDDG